MLKVISEVVVVVILILESLRFKNGDSPASSLQHSGRVSNGLREAFRQSTGFLEVNSIVAVTVIFKEWVRSRITHTAGGSLSEGVCCAAEDVGRYFVFVFVGLIYIAVNTFEETVVLGMDNLILHVNNSILNYPASICSR